MTENTVELVDKNSFWRHNGIDLENPVKDIYQFLTDIHTALPFLPRPQRSLKGSSVELPTVTRNLTCFLQTEDVSSFNLIPHWSHFSFIYAWGGNGLCPECTKAQLTSHIIKTLQYTIHIKCSYYQLVWWIQFINSFRAHYFLIHRFHLHSEAHSQTV